MRPHRGHPVYTLSSQVVQALNAMVYDSEQKSITPLWISALCKLEKVCMGV